MNRSGRLLSPNVRHTNIVPWFVCCFARYCRHDTLHTISISISICTVQFCVVPQLASISSTWCTLWWAGIILIQWQRGGTRGGADRVDGLHQWSTHKYLHWLCALQFCVSFRSYWYLGPDSLLLVAAGCGLRVPLPALTAIENSRQGSPFPNIRHEQEKSTYLRSIRNVIKESHLALSNK